ncbi:MAG: hypothetical protein ABI870_16285 [Rhodanobacter sp.]
MRLSILCLILAAACTLTTTAIASRDAPPASMAPVIFAAGTIAGDADDGAAAFTPDGATVYFMRGTDGSALMESHFANARWSKPKVASFSGTWRDLDPAMAPDGSFLLFVSNRPDAPGGKAIDAIHAGKRRVAQGMNLWRVNRQANGWSAPTRLPDLVNRCSMTFAPSVAADGSIYFIGCADQDDGLHLLRSAYHDGRYAAPETVKLGDADTQIRDPAIAPDRSFIVFSMKQGMQQPYRLAIAFRTRDGWSAPLDLGDTVNGGKHSMGAQLGPDHRTLYFYSDRRLPPTSRDGAAAWNNGDDHIWQVSLAPWLDAHSHGMSAQEGASTGSSSASTIVPWNSDYDASLAFVPDRKSLFFTRGRGLLRRILYFQRHDGSWSPPQAASFSGPWMDMEPAMAPDGSYLIFASNRPAQPSGKALDGYYDDKPQPQRGGNLWRIDRRGNVWSAAVRLPDVVNSGSSIYAPAVAANGSLYFMKADPASSHFRLYLSRLVGGQLQPALPLPFSDGVTDDYDPTVAPDQSFIVFTSDRKPSSATSSDLFIAFATFNSWSLPIDLGKAGTEARLDPDGATIYFSGSDKRVHRLSLAPWLARHPEFAE